MGLKSYFGIFLPAFYKLNSTIRDCTAQPTIYHSPMPYSFTAATSWIRFSSFSTHFSPYSFFNLLWNASTIQSCSVSINLFLDGRIYLLCFLRASSEQCRWICLDQSDSSLTSFLTFLSWIDVDWTLLTVAVSLPKSLMGTLFPES